MITEKTLIYLVGILTGMTITMYIWVLRLWLELWLNRQQPENWRPWQGLIFFFRRTTTITLDNHTEDDIKQAIKNNLPDRWSYKVDIEVRTSSAEWVHADIHVKEEDAGINVYRIPEIVQNVRLNSGLYDLRVVTKPEKLGLKG